MSGNTFGKIFKITTFGESHGTAMGCILDGCPPQIELNKGKQFDEAIKVLRPPVFWKEKSDFKRHCLMWPANIIDNIINEVLSSEIKCMTNNIIAKEQCEKTLFGISSTAKRFSRN